MTDFTFYTPEQTSKQTQNLLVGIKKGLGFIPNMFGYMAEAPTTIEAYLELNGLVAKTSLTTAQQQIALLAVSVENGCDFCVIAHRAIGKMKNVDTQTLNQITLNNEVVDVKDRALVKFAQSVTRNRGRQPEAEVLAFLDAGFTKQQIFEVILIVSIKTLSNYINHLTLPEPNTEWVDMIEPILKDACPA